MKNLALFLLFVLFFMVMHSVSYSGGGAPYFYGNNDSLLFDDDEAYQEIQPDPDKDCYVIVYNAVGATGDVWRRSIKTVCGVPDTVWEIKRNVKLRITDRLVGGSTAKVDKDPKSVLETFFGSNQGEGKVVTMDFKVGPNSTFLVPDVNEVCTALKGNSAPGPIKEDFKSGKILVDMKQDITQLGQDIERLKLGAAILIFETANTVIDHMQTKFSIDVNVTGSDTTDVIKVYEGSVTLTSSKKSSGNKKTSGDDAQKLMEDYRNGKITAEEMQKKLKELTQNLETQSEELMPVTVEAGNKCTATNSKLTVEPIESNDDRWWENTGK